MTSGRAARSRMWMRIKVLYHNVFGGLPNLLHQLATFTPFRSDAAAYFLEYAIFRLLPVHGDFGFVFCPTGPIFGLSDIVWCLWPREVIPPTQFRWPRSVSSQFSGNNTVRAFL